MTPVYVEKRAATAADNLEKMRESLKHVKYELGRQGFYVMEEIIGTAIHQMREPIETLKSVPNYTKSMQHVC